MQGSVTGDAIVRERGRGDEGAAEEHRSTSVQGLLGAVPRVLGGAEGQGSTDGVPTHAGEGLERRGGRGLRETRQRRPTGLRRDQGGSSLRACILVRRVALVPCRMGKGHIHIHISASLPLDIFLLARHDSNEKPVFAGCPLPAVSISSSSVVEGLCFTKFFFAIFAPTRE